MSPSTPPIRKPCKCPKGDKGDSSLRADGEYRCHQCGATWNINEVMAAELKRLHLELSRANPDMDFVLDDSGVWLRHNGTDYGVYQKTVTGQIVLVFNFATHVTVVHRPTPTPTSDAPITH